MAHSQTHTQIQLNRLNMSVGQSVCKACTYVPTTTTRPSWSCFVRVAVSTTKWNWIRDWKSSGGPATQLKISRTRNPTKWEEKSVFLVKDLPPSFTNYLRDQTHILGKETKLLLEWGMTFKSPMSSSLGDERIFGFNFTAFSVGGNVCDLCFC